MIWLFPSSNSGKCRFVGIYIPESNTQVGFFRQIRQLLLLFRGHDRTNPNNAPVYHCKPLNSEVPQNDHMFALHATPKT